MLAFFCSSVLKVLILRKSNLHFKPFLLLRWDERGLGGTSKHKIFLEGKNNLNGDERIKKDMASAKWLCFTINHSGWKSTQAPVSAGADDLAYALFLFTWLLSFPLI